MRIAFVTQWFPPEPGMLVASSIADGLAARGHHVDVLTGFPNYPTGRLHPDHPLRPYRREERSERVTVHRAPLYPSHDRSAARRAANYVSFAASSAWVARRRLQRPDAWLTYSSPATAALAALTVPAHLRAPSYLLVQDLWPDSVTDSGFVGGPAAGAVGAALGRFCAWTYRAAAGIGVISPSMRDILVGRGADPARVHLTPNWVDDGHLLPGRTATDDLRRELGLPTGRLFMYAGNMGGLQGLAPLAEAFGRCPGATLAFVGDGVERADLEAAARGLPNVHFVDPQPESRIGLFIAASDVQVVSLKDTALLRATMPSKVQTSLAAGRPILAHAAGDVADLVTAAGAGRAVPPGDVAALADAVRSMSALPRHELLAMGRRARACFERDFAKDPGLDRLERLLGGFPAAGAPRVPGAREPLPAGELAAP